MGDIVFCAFYLLLFSFIIWKSALFNLPGLNKTYSLGAFYLKLIFGVILWYIYAFHYKNRYSSDIFKYFDDGKLMYQSIHTSFSDFARMFTGIDDKDQHIQGYYHSMASWVNIYDSNLYNNSHFLIRLNAFFMFFSQGHYGVHVICMCFISLAGLAFIYKSFYPFISNVHKSLFAAVFLFPSVLLWSSGILKEGLVLLGLGLTIYYFRKLLTKEGKPVLNTLLFALGIVLLFEIKAYVLLCLIPGLVAEAVVSKIKMAGNHPWVTYILVVGIYISVGLNLRLISPRLDPIQMIEDKQVDFMHTAKGGIYLVPFHNDSLYAYIDVDDSVNIIPANTQADTLLHHRGIQYLTTSAFCYNEEQNNTVVPFMLKPGTRIDIISASRKDTFHLEAKQGDIYRLDTYIEPAKSRIDITLIPHDLKGLLYYIPKALAISFIRPYPHEIHSTTLLMYAIENVSIYLLLVFALIFRKRKNTNNHIIAFCMSYCLLMLVLIGVSTPLYGGIERYKSVVIPFMLILLLLIYDKEKFKRTLKG